MNTTELVDVLAEIAKRVGGTAPTLRKIESFVKRGLIAASQPVGRGRNQEPRWQMSESAIESAKLIVQFEASGTRRADGLRFRLWLREHGQEVSEVRLSLRSEFRRLVQAQRRKHLKPWMQSQSEATDPAKLEGRRNRLGPLDERLSPFRLQSETLVALAASMFAGQIGEFDEAALISKELTSVFSRFATTPLAPFNLFTGLFGASDEVDWDALTIILDASDRTFFGARAIWRVLSSVFDQPEVSGTLLGVFLSSEQQISRLKMRGSLASLEWEMLLFILSIRLLDSGIANEVENGLSGEWRELLDRLFESKRDRQLVEPLLSLVDHIKHPPSPEKT